jgi:hypothetical protein
MHIFLHGIKKLGYESGYFYPLKHPLFDVLGDKYGFKHINNIIVMNTIYLIVKILKPRFLQKNQVT